MKKLKVLYMSNNLVKDWGALHVTVFLLQQRLLFGSLFVGCCGSQFYSLCFMFYVAEFVRLADLPCLVDLVFVGNPLQESHVSEGNWMEEACKKLPNLKKLDGEIVKLLFI